MALSISSKCVILLSLQLILFDFTSGVPDVLTGSMRNGNEFMHFRWRKTSQLLANHNLPVWTVRKNNNSEPEFTLRTEKIFNHIGDFVFYQDEEKSSAIVYLIKYNVINGMVDTRFIIHNMPIDEIDSGHEVGSVYLKVNKKSFFNHSSLRPLDLSIPRNRNMRHFESPRSQSSSQHHQMHITKLYPEILLLIPNEVVNEMNNVKKGSVANIVFIYLVYFNLIDMLFAKLSTESIRTYINVAGIVIESEPNTFPFLHYIKVPDLSIPPVKVRAFNTQGMFCHLYYYLHKHRGIFPVDSFDFFFLPTVTPLWVRGIFQWVAGVSRFHDRFESRLGNNVECTALGAMFHHAYYLDYVAAAHEIAHLMNIEHDKTRNAFFDSCSQCFAIMQQKSKYCYNCLKWSAESYNQYIRFGSKNINRCFLLNKPRSLYPNGSRLNLLTASEQCHCYGHDDLYPYYDDPLIESGCQNRLLCTSKGSPVEAILPLDGTPCGFNKVCWNQKCQDLTNESY